MSFTAEVVKEHLGKLLAHLEPLHAFSNSYFSAFFTQNLWDKQIPEKIQKELASLESLNDFISLYPKIVKNRHPKKFEDKHPEVVSFVRNAVDVSIVYNKKYSKVLTDLENFFLSEGHSADCDFILEDFMSKKKLHEVKTSGRMTALLAKLTRSSHIVDVGGGKGYLSSTLSLHHSFKVLGLDSSEISTCGALKRSEKVAKAWSGGIFDDSSTKKSRQELMKKYYKQVVTTVDSHTDVVHLLKKSFEEDVTGITLTGLHTCGNLASTCLRMFLQNEDVKALLNVGCCYHLITEEFFSRDSRKGVRGLREDVTSGFPLSDFLKREEFKLGRNTRILASHSLEKIYENDDLHEDFQYSQMSILYRAILEDLIKKANIDVSEEKRVGRLAKKCKTFHQYIRKALEKLDVNIQMSDSELDKILENYQDQKPMLTAFFLLRVTLAPVVESIILLDRILYLIEHNIKNVYLVRLFDLKTSPRGFGVIAWKDLDKR